MDDGWVAGRERHGNWLSRPTTKGNKQYLPPHGPAAHLLETATMRCELTIPAFRIFMCSPPPTASSNLRHSCGRGQRQRQEGQRLGPEAPCP
jgi:hypothetical protein